MKLSSKGAEFLRGHEGFVSNWYLDPVKVLTIGIGFTWKSDSFRVWWKKNKSGTPKGEGSMTRKEADAALIYLCQKEYGAAVDRFLTKGVSQHVFDGMVSPVYNLGARALKWKWALACKDGHYATGARLLTNTGTTAKGRKLPGLIRRRKEEALLIGRGIYTGVHGGETRPPVDAMADGILMRGERGPAVAQMLRDLKALGYYDGRIDDLFGPGAEAAVLAFQRERGLKADGYAGSQTLHSLDLGPPRDTVTPKRVNLLDMILAFIKAIFRR